MPRLATTRDPLALALRVKDYLPRFRYLAAVCTLDANKLPDTFHLFGSETSCTDALIEAVGEFPGCQRHGEYERLANADLAEIMARHRADPLQSTFEHLGLINPDGTPLH